MNGLWLIIGGLSLSLGWCAWRQYRLQQQLEQLTHLLPGGFGSASALSPLYRLRRGIEALAQTQQELEIQTAFWQSVLEQAPLGYLQVDQDNRLLWCNQAARKLLQIDRWQAGRSRLLIEIVRSYELDRLIEKTRKTQQLHQKDWVFQMTTLQAADAHEIYQIALQGTSLVLSDKQVGIFLQDRQPIMDALQERDRTFSDLTHELRTPLTAIQLVAETLQPRLQGKEQNWVRQMRQELDRLMGLVEGCLDFSRLTAHPEQVLQPEVLPLQPQIESAWQTLKPLADQQHITLQYSEQPSGIDVYGDQQRLMQVWFNLLDNAIKHSPPHRVVVVNVTEQDEGVCINIIDEGNGFRVTDLEHVFERLYRGEPSRVRKRSPVSPSSPPPVLNNREGSGLGLSITQQIIQAHNGKITAQNHPQTQGAWLQVKLPKLH